MEDDNRGHKVYDLSCREDAQVGSGWERACFISDIGTFISIVIWFGVFKLTKDRMLGMNVINENCTYHCF